MGYNTTYELGWNGEVSEELLEHSLYEILTANLDPNTSYYQDELKYIRRMTEDLAYNDYYIGKWYSHMDTMKKLSSMYPSVTFYLEGKGEDSDDTWTAVFRNGKSYKFNQGMFIKWLIKKYGGDADKLSEEFIDSHLK